MADEVSPNPTEDGIAACEKFVKDNKALNLAYLNGTLNDWIAKELAAEMAAANGN